MNRSFRALSAIVIVALVVAACGGTGASPTGSPAGTPEGTAATAATPAATATTAATGSPTTGLRSPEEVALEAAGGQKIGGRVSVMAVWGGSELEHFNAMIKPFEDATGITVDYEGTRDLDTVLTSRVAGGNPPDMAGLPGVGKLQEFAKSGALVALDSILDMNKLKAQYDQGWIDLGTYQGKLYGIFSKAAVKSEIYYDPKAFAAKGYQVPKSWDELMKLSQTIADSGTSPWCIGLESGGATGWPGKDWIADIYLQQNGTEMYDKWVSHQIPWTDPTVKKAWETWGTIVNNEKFVYGGKQGVLSTNFGESPFPEFTDPPGCYMHHQANFITDFILKQYPDLKAGEDFTFFVTPPATAGAASPLMTAGDLFGVFKDTPQSEALIRYLTSAEAQAIWVKLGGFLSANKTVPIDLYPDPINKASAEMLAKASAVRFGAGDLLPGAVGEPFTHGVVQFVQDPSSLDSVLSTIEDAAKSAY